MAAPAEDAALCPFCGEALPGVVRACPHCDEDLTAMAAADVADQVAEATRADAAEGRFRHIRPEEFRRFRVATFVWAAVFLLCVVLAAGFTGSRNGGVVLAVLGWIFGFVSITIVLVFGIKDLLLLRPEAITTPEAAMRTFVKCLREKRWDYARSLVVPRGREGVRRRPAIESLKVPAAEIPVDDPKAFRAFWEPLLHSTGPTLRNCSPGRVVAERDGEDRAAACCPVKVTAYPRWTTYTILINLIVPVILYYAMRKSETIDVETGLLRVGGRWYLLDAVPPLAEDPQGLRP